MARTSTHDLLFAIPGQTFPFEDTVHVSWMDGVFEFTLSAERGKIVTCDRCLDDTAPWVLDAFLSRLVGDSWTVDTLQAPPGVEVVGVLERDESWIIRLYADVDKRELGSDAVRAG